MTPRTKYTFFNYHLKKFAHPVCSQLLIPTHPAKVFHPLSCPGCQVNTLYVCAVSGEGNGSCSEGRSLNIISLIAFSQIYYRLFMKGKSPALM